MKPDVFISYSSQDFSRVMPLVNRLRSTGISLWVDEGNIDAATLWSESIVDAIAECTVLIMMVSLHSTSSHNVVKEVMIASESKKTILPIYLEPAEIPSKLKYQLTGIQHLEWFNGGSDDIFEILKDSLLKIGVNTNTEIVNLNESKSRIIALKTQRDEKKKKSKLHISYVILAFIVLFFTTYILSIFSNRNYERDFLVKQIPLQIPVSLPNGEKFDFTMQNQWGKNIAISPNGRKIAILIEEDARSERNLWLLDLNNNKYSKLASSSALNGIRHPFFSNDNKWIAYFDEKKLKRISIESKEINIICDAVIPFGGSWADDNTLCYSQVVGLQLWQVNLRDSLDPEKIVSYGGNFKLKNKIKKFAWPNYLPKNKGILFSGSAPNFLDNNGSIYHINTSTLEITLLVNNGFSPFYSETGHLLYLRDNTIKAREFDIETLKVGSEEISLISGIQMNPNWGIAQFSISKNGTLVFIPGKNLAKGSFSWIHRDGRKEIIDKFKPAMYGRFSLSPDGNMIAVPIAEKRNDIFILNLMTGASTKISKSGYNWQPLWNSSGNKIVFHNSDVGQKTGYIKMANSDGTGKEVIVYSSDKEMMTESWSKIGNKLSISFLDDGTSGYLDLNKESPAIKKFASSDGTLIFGATFSPNGKWIAYSSAKSGSLNCYIAPLSNLENAIIISNKFEGEEPMWSPNGDEVFYRSSSGLYSVKLDFDQFENVAIGETKLINDTPWIDNVGIGYDIHPSGDKFLMVVHKEKEVSENFNIVLNFDSLILEKFSELNKSIRP